MHFIRVFLVAILAIMFVESSLAVCCNDENAYPSDCKNQCVNNCEKKMCTMVCEKGCSCKSGFVYDDNVKRCVLRKNCSRRGRY